MYREYGNMNDINRMELNEFVRCIHHISNENKRRDGKFVPLDRKQKNLIEEAKKCQKQEVPSS